MNLIAQLTDQSVWGLSRNYSGRRILHRQAARAVLVDAEGKIALMQVTNRGFYKLPGGGIDPDEDIKTALNREVMEETGCSCEIANELGMVIEVKYNPDEAEGEIQFSYCYLAKLIGKKGTPKFTAEELAERMELKWVDIDEALQLVGENTEHYVGRFITQRDTAILKAAQRLIG